MSIICLNNILTGLGIALTIILGLSTVITIDGFLFFVTMTSILVIGLVVFVMFNLIMVREQADKAGIIIKGNNKWMTLIQNASKII